MRPLISAYMDGELSTDEAVQLHEHLAVCPSCRALLEDYCQLRSQLRFLPPTEPPPHLRARVWNETIERDALEHRGVRRWVQRPRLGFATAALSVALLLVLALGLSLGYQRLVPPAVAGSQPESGQLWPIYQPIEITFNKPMNRESVLANLRISPAAERNRLPISWRGTTLVIGADEHQRALLLPDTVYTVAIRGTAEDQWGHPLGKDWVLRFRTTTVIAGQATPTPSPSPTPTPAVSQPTPTPAQAVVEPPPPPAPTPTPLPPQPADDGAAAQATEPPPPPTPTPPPPTPTPVPTPTAVPPASPSPTIEPTPSPEPSPSPAATPAPTVTPVTPQPTPPVAETAPEPIPVTGAFGPVYWGDPVVQQKLGQPVSYAYAVSAAEMDFQRGLMIERFDAATIYVIVADGTWFPVSDEWAPEAWPAAQQVESNLWTPGGAFGAAWSEQALQETLGYAIEPEPHLMHQGAVIQEFEHGILLLSDRGFVYLLLDSGTWEQFPAPGELSETETAAPNPYFAEGTPTPTP